MLELDASGADIGEIQSFDDFDEETERVVNPWRSSFGARWLHEARGAKPQRNWLVKGLVEAGSFGIVYGPPGCGKSFLVSDMALALAAGAMPGADRPDWFGHKGTPAGVVYVVAEGSSDFEIRLHAWMAENDIPDDAVIPFVYLPTSVNLRSDSADAKKLANEITALSAEMERLCGVRVGLVVIDTVARALSGGNENASEVMSAFVDNCGLVQKACKVAVLGVHHGGKEGGRGPRGHESLHGAADFEFEVSAATEEGTPNLWVARKVKAGPGGAIHPFRLRARNVGVDDDGDAITSCTVVNLATPHSAARAGEKPKGFRVKDGEREFLTVLADVIDSKGVTPAPELNVPRDVLLVANMDDVRLAYRERYWSTEEGSDDQIESRLGTRWRRATKQLLKFNIIGSQKPWLFFTGREVQSFRLRGVQPPNPYANRREPSEREPVRPEPMHDADGVFPDDDQTLT